MPREKPASQYCRTTVYHPLTICLWRKRVIFKMAWYTTSSSQWPYKCFQWPFSRKLDWAQGKGRLCIPVSHRPLLMWYYKAHYVPLNSIRVLDFKHENKIACAIIWLQKIKEACYSVDTSLSTVHWCWWCFEHLRCKQLSHFLWLRSSNVTLQSSAHNQVTVWPIQGHRSLPKNLTGPKLIKKFLAFYENESSLPCLQRPATCTCNQSGNVQFKSIKYKHIPNMFYAIFHIPVISVFYYFRHKSTVAKITTLQIFQWKESQINFLLHFVICSPYQTSSSGQNL